MIFTFEAVAFHFGDKTLSGVGCISGRCRMPGVLGSCAPPCRCIPSTGHSRKATYHAIGQRLLSFRWGNPPLYHLKDGILGCLSYFVSGLDGKEAYHLVLLAGGDNGEILHIADYPLSGAQRFQLHAATGAGASANGVRKVVSALPRMSALGADVRAVCPLTA